MKKSYLILAIVLIVILLVSMPFLFLGMPSPLFSITNNDNNDHTVTIEIFDSTNHSLFKEVYELDPEANIHQSKPTLLILGLAFPPGDKKECTIKVTLDENISETSYMELGLWDIVDITLYDDHEESPIFIGLMSA